MKKVFFSPLVLLIILGYSEADSTRFLLISTQEDGCNGCISARCGGVGKESLFRLMMIDRDDIIFEFVSRVFNSSNTSLVGIVGELDSTTVSIMHTLSSRAHLSITLVSAGSVFPSLLDQQFSRVVDMNPLLHKIEALILFLDRLNWS